MGQIKELPCYSQGPVRELFATFRADVAWPVFTQPLLTQPLVRTGIAALRGGPFALVSLVIRQ